MAAGVSLLGALALLVVVVSSAAADQAWRRRFRALEQQSSETDEAIQVSINCLKDGEYRQWLAGTRPGRAPTPWKWGRSSVAQLHELYARVHDNPRMPQCERPVRLSTEFCVLEHKVDAQFLNQNDPRNGRIRSIKFQAGYFAANSCGGDYVMPVMTALYGDATTCSGVFQNNVVSGHIINHRLGGITRPTAGAHAFVNQNPLNFFVQTSSSNRFSTWADAENFMKQAVLLCKKHTPAPRDCAAHALIEFSYADDQSGAINRLAPPIFTNRAGYATQNSYIPTGGKYSIQLSRSAWKLLLEKLYNRARQDEIGEAQVEYAGQQLTGGKRGPGTNPKPIAVNPKRRKTTDSSGSESESSSESDGDDSDYDHENDCTKPSAKPQKKLPYLNNPLLAHFVSRVARSREPAAGMSEPCPIHWSNTFVQPPARATLVRNLQTKVTADGAKLGARRWESYRAAFVTPPTPVTATLFREKSVWSHWVLSALPQTWLWRWSGAIIPLPPHPRALARRAAAAGRT